MPSACSSVWMPPGAVGPARSFMNRAHLRGEFCVRLSAREGRAFAPRVVDAGGDFQQPAHCRNPMHGLIRTHEFVRRDSTEPLSVANQAAAFESISRSSRRTRFSRRSRVSSCRVVSQPVKNDCPHRALPAPPSYESTGPSAQTPSRDRRGYAQLAPTPPFAAGVPVHTVRGSWASWLSFPFPIPPLSTKPGQLQFHLLSYFSRGQDYRLSAKR